MNQNSFVEILMATYNGERFVSEQIDSILHQDYPHFHLIIRDDGSKDKTLEILHSYTTKYPDKISLLPATGNLGVIGNFSELMAQSKAPYVMLSDQDDVWHPNKIRATLTAMLELEKNQEHVPLLVHTDLTVVDQHLKEIAPSFWRYSNLDIDNHRSLYRLLGQNIVTGCTVMVNRPLLQLALPIPKETLMHDWWLALVANAFGQIGNLDLRTISYRQHSSNQVGAHNGRYSVVLKQVLQDKNRYISRANSVLDRQEKQAQFFMARYEKHLSEQQKFKIKAFLRWLRGSLFQKLAIMMRHGCLKKGFFKNLGLFLLRTVSGRRV